MPAGAKEVALSDYLGVRVGSHEAQAMDRRGSSHDLGKGALRQAGSAKTGRGPQASYRT